MCSRKIQVGMSYNISPTFSFRASDMQLAYIYLIVEVKTAVVVTYEVFNVILRDICLYYDFGKSYV